MVIHSDLSYFFASTGVPIRCDPAAMRAGQRGHTLHAHPSHGTARQRLSQQNKTLLARPPLGHGSPYPSFRRLRFRKLLLTPLPFGWSSKHEVETEGASVKHAQCILFAPQPLIDVQDLMLLSEEMAANSVKLNSTAGSAMRPEARR
jgi:hypothetical protein